VPVEPLRPRLPHPVYKLLLMLDVVVAATADETRIAEVAVGIRIVLVVRIVLVAVEEDVAAVAVEGTIVTRAEGTIVTRAEGTIVARVEGTIVTRVEGTTTVTTTIIASVLSSKMYSCLKMGLGVRRSNKASREFLHVSF
jgi:hypothetical protein